MAQTIQIDPTETPPWRGFALAFANIGKVQHVKIQTLMAFHYA